jgi:hypothetical protein
VGSTYVTDSDISGITIFSVASEGLSIFNTARTSIVVRLVLCVRGGGRSHADAVGQ